MRKINKLIGLGTLFALSACMESQPLGDPPPPSEIERVARLAHQNTYGRPAVGLQIGQLHRVPMFSDSEEFMVCLSTQQPNVGAVFDNAGNQLAADGAPFRQSHGLHIKLYNSGWGSGIFRRVEEGKMGRINISDYCPGSVQPWRK